MDDINTDEIRKKVLQQPLNEKTLLIEDTDYEGTPLITSDQFNLLKNPGEFEVKLLSRSKKNPFIAGQDSVTPKGIFLGIIIGASTTVLIAFLIYLYKKKQLADFTFFNYQEGRSIQVTKEKMKIMQPVADINTGFVESTSRLCNELFSLLWANPGDFSTETISNFSVVAEFLVNAMHKDASERSFFRDSADAWSAANKDMTQVRMEVAWFQPRLREKLVERFGQKISREENDVYGSVDLKAFGIPIECKVLKDKDNHPVNSSGLEILENYEQQAFQEMMHVNCGFLICYDYRLKTSAPELQIQSVTERFQLKRQTDKILLKIVFLGNMKKPSAITR